MNSFIHAAKKNGVQMIEAKVIEFFRHHKKGDDINLEMLETAALQLEYRARAVRMLAQHYKHQTRPTAVINHKISLLLWGNLSDTDALIRHLILPEEPKRD